MTVLPPPFIFSHLFLYKKHQEKTISESEKKWICKHKGFEDKLFKDLLFHPGTNITEKRACWKHVSIIILLLFFKIFLRHYSYSLYFISDNFFNLF